MKNFLFGLIAVVAFSASGFANQFKNQVVTHTYIDKSVSILLLNNAVEPSVLIQLDETKCYYRIVTRNVSTGIITYGQWIEYPCGSIMQTKVVQ